MLIKYINLSSQWRVWCIYNQWQTFSVSETDSPTLAHTHTQTHFLQREKIGKGENFVVFFHQVNHDDQALLSFILY